MTLPSKTDARSAHWQHHIDHWQASGLSCAAYCRQHDLSYDCFIYWRRKFHAMAAEQTVHTGAENQALSAFVAVQPAFSQTGVNGDELHLCLPTGLEIRHIYASNLNHVRALVECLS